MTYATLNNIIRSTLLQTGKPIHYYLDGLIYSRECVRELSYDDLKVVTPVLLPVSDTFSVNLPPDFVDFVSVGVRIGQLVRPLVQQSNINRLVNYNSAGQPSTYYANPPNDTYGPPGSDLYINIPIGLYWGTTTIDDYGESVGRLFGWGAGSESDTFIYLPERNQIQLNEYVGYTEIVLVYIGNGTGCNAATQVDNYAQATITAYIKWQFKENSRTYGIADKEWAKSEYTTQRSILRARKNDLTINDIKRIMQKNYMASAKRP